MSWLSPGLHRPLLFTGLLYRLLQAFQFLLCNNVMPILAMEMGLLACGQQASGFPARTLCLVERFDDLRIAHGDDFGYLDARRHVRTNIQYRQVDHIFQEVRDELGRKPRRGNGRDLHRGLARAATRIRFILLCPFLDYAVARERLVCIVPSESQAPPELWMIPVPIVVETQAIPSKMCAAGEHAC